MGLNFKLGNLNISTVKRIEKDNADNIFYWHYLNELSNFVSEGKADLDMSNQNDKLKALASCTPFATVIEKCSSLFSNGRLYIQDKDGNELDSYDNIRKLLRQPNPLQNGKHFLKQIEYTLKTFGYCPIYKNTVLGLTKSMYIIQPYLFHITYSGKLLNQLEREDIIKEAYIDWNNGQTTSLKPDEYFIIYEGEMVIPQNKDEEITFTSIIDSLSLPVNNWLAQMFASHTLIVNGGPKGILCDGGTNGYGYALDSTEKKNIEEKFLNNYGLVGKSYPILVTTASLKWIPLNYDSSQLKLHEEDDRCTEKISNAIGLNPNVFVPHSKYNNQTVAKRDSYQDLIIPDAERVAETLTSALCEEGCYIKIDYSHLECLQRDKESASASLVNAANALSSLIKEGVITTDEARKELSNYIDIDPENVKGTLKNTDNGTK